MDVNYLEILWKKAAFNRQTLAFTVARPLFFFFLGGGGGEGRGGVSGMSLFLQTGAQNEQGSIKKVFNALECKP